MKMWVKSVSYIVYMQPLHAYIHLTSRLYPTFKPTIYIPPPLPYPLHTSDLLGWRDAEGDDEVAEEEEVGTGAGDLVDAMKSLATSDGVGDGSRARYSFSASFLFIASS